MKDASPVDTRTLRWTCPHCLGGHMTLQSAHRHLRRRHYDCLSCQTEALMVKAMAEGMGYVVPRSDPFARLFSRARS